MDKRKKNSLLRRSFISSLLSLMLCVCMLLGTTYAWFTDSVTSGTNKLVDGNLDVEVYYCKGGNDTNQSGNWKALDGQTDLFKEAQWEPGHTEYVYLKVVNVGTVSFNYKVNVTPVNEVGGINVYGQSFLLSDYLTFGMSSPEEDVPSYDRDDARGVAKQKIPLNQTEGLPQAGVLYAVNDVPENGLSTAYLTLVIYMAETVGNEANYMTGTTAPYLDFAVRVDATQLQYEKDSFDETYDGGAVEGTGYKGVVPEYSNSFAYTTADVSNQAVTLKNTSIPSTISKDDNSVTKETTVEFPAGIVGLTDSTSVHTAKLAVASTRLLPSTTTSAFDIVDDRGAVGAIDLKVWVDDKQITEFKDSAGNAVPVTVTTYIAKGLTLNTTQNSIQLKYVGDDGADQPTLVSYDTGTGELKFTTTHFSIFTVGADQVAYIERLDTAYRHISDAVAAAATGDTIIMIKDTVESKVIEVSKDITIDLNGKYVYDNVHGNDDVISDEDGYTIGYGEGNRLFSVSDCNFTITDSTGNGAMYIKNLSEITDDDIDRLFPEENEDIYDKSDYNALPESGVVGSTALIGISALGKDTTVNLSNFEMSGTTRYYLIKVSGDSWREGAALVDIVEVGEYNDDDYTLELNMTDIHGTTNYHYQTTNGVYGKEIINITDCVVESGTQEGDDGYSEAAFYIDSLNTESKATFTNVTATSDCGPIIEVIGTQAEFTNCNFTVTGLKAPEDWYSTTIGVSWEGVATINSGTYLAEEYSALDIYSTGGTITVNDGTFTGYCSLHSNESNYNESFVYNINGGTFNGSIDLASSTTKNITGGTFSVDPTSYLPTGTSCEQVDGKWVVKTPTVVSTDGELRTALESGKEYIKLADNASITNFSTAITLNNKTVTIDMNGNALTFKQGITLKGSKLYFKNTNSTSCTLSFSHNSPTAGIRNAFTVSGSTIDISSSIILSRSNFNLFSMVDPKGESSLIMSGSASLSQTGNICDSTCTYSSKTANSVTTYTITATN